MFEDKYASFSTQKPVKLPTDFSSTTDLPYLSIHKIKEVDKIGTFVAPTTNSLHTVTNKIKNVHTDELFTNMFEDKYASFSTQKPVKLPTDFSSTTDLPYFSTHKIKEVDKIRTYVQPATNSLDTVTNVHTDQLFTNIFEDKYASFSTQKPVKLPTDFSSTTDLPYLSIHKIKEVDKIGTFVAPTTNSLHTVTNKIKNVHTDELFTNMFEDKYASFSTQKPVKLPTRFFFNNKFAIFFTTHKIKEVDKIRTYVQPATNSLDTVTNVHTDQLFTNIFEDKYASFSTQKPVKLPTDFSSTTDLPYLSIHKIKEVDKIGTFVAPTTNSLHTVTNKIKNVHTDELFTNMFEDKYASFSTQKPVKLPTDFSSTTNLPYLSTHKIKEVDKIRTYVQPATNSLDTVTNKIKNVHTDELFTNIFEDKYASFSTQKPVKLPTDFSSTTDLPYLSIHKIKEVDKIGTFVAPTTNSLHTVTNKIKNVHTDELFTNMFEDKYASFSTQKPVKLPTNFSSTTDLPYFSTHKIKEVDKIRTYVQPATNSLDTVTNVHTDQLFTNIFEDKYASFSTQKPVKLPTDFSSTTDLPYLSIHKIKEVDKIGTFVAPTTNSLHTVTNKIKNVHTDELFTNMFEDKYASFSTQKPVKLPTNFSSTTDLPYFSTHKIKEVDKIRTYVQPATNSLDTVTNVHTDELFTNIFEDKYASFSTQKPVKLPTDFSSTTDLPYLSIHKIKEVDKIGTFVAPTTNSLHTVTNKIKNVHTDELFTNMFEDKYASFSTQKPVKLPTDFSSTTNLPYLSTHKIKEVDKIRTYVQPATNSLDTVTNVHTDQLFTNIFEDKYASFSTQKPVKLPTDFSSTTDLPYLSIHKIKEVDKIGTFVAPTTNSLHTVTNKIKNVHTDELFTNMFEDKYASFSTQKPVKLPTNFSSTTNLPYFSTHKIKEVDKIRTYVQPATNSLDTVTNVHTDQLFTNIFEDKYASFSTQKPVKLPTDFSSTTDLPYLSIHKIKEVDKIGTFVAPTTNSLHTVTNKIKNVHTDELFTNMFEDKYASFSTQKPVKLPTDFSSTTNLPYLSTHKIKEVDKIRTYVQPATNSLDTVTNVHTDELFTNIFEDKYASFSTQKPVKLPTDFSSTTDLPYLSIHKIKEVDKIGTFVAPTTNSLHTVTNKIKNVHTDELFTNMFEDKYASFSTQKPVKLPTNFSSTTDLPYFSTHKIKEVDKIRTYVQPATNSLDTVTNVHTDQLFTNIFEDKYASFSTQKPVKLPTDFSSTTDLPYLSIHKIKEVDKIGTFVAPTTNSLHTVTNKIKNVHTDELFTNMFEDKYASFSTQKPVKLPTNFSSTTDLPYFSTHKIKEVDKIRTYVQPATNSLDTVTNVHTDQLFTNIFEDKYASFSTQKPVKLPTDFSSTTDLPYLSIHKIKEVDKIGTFVAPTTNSLHTVTNKIKNVHTDELFTNMFEDKYASFSTQKPVKLPTNFSSTTDLPYLSTHKIKEVDKIRTYVQPATNSLDTVTNVHTDQLFTNIFEDKYASFSTQKPVKLPTDFSSTTDLPYLSIHKIKEVDKIGTFVAPTTNSLHTVTNKIKNVHTDELFTNMFEDKYASFSTQKPVKLPTNFSSTTDLPYFSTHKIKEVDKIGTGFNDDYIPSIIETTTKINVHYFSPTISTSKETKNDNQNKYSTTTGLQDKSLTSYKPLKFSSPHPGYSVTYTTKHSDDKIKGTQLISISNKLDHPVDSKELVQDSVSPLPIYMTPKEPFYTNKYDKEQKYSYSFNPQNKYKTTVKSLKIPSDSLNHISTLYPAIYVTENNKDKEYTLFSSPEEQFIKPLVSLYFKSATSEYVKKPLMTKIIHNVTVPEIYDEENLQPTTAAPTSQNKELLTFPILQSSDYSDFHNAPAMKQAQVSNITPQNLMYRQNLQEFDILNRSQMLENFSTMEKDIDSSNKPLLYPTSKQYTKSTPSYNSGVFHKSVSTVHTSHAHSSRPTKKQLFNFTTKSTFSNNHKSLFNKSDSSLHAPSIYNSIPTKKILFYRATKPFILLPEKQLTKTTSSTKWLKFIPTKSYAATKQPTNPTLLNSTYITPHIQNYEGTLTKLKGHKIPSSTSPPTNWLKFLPTKSYTPKRQPTNPTLPNSTYTTPRIQNSEGTLTKIKTHKFPSSTSPPTKWLKFLSTKPDAPKTQPTNITLPNSTYTTPYIQKSEGTLTKIKAHKIPSSTSPPTKWLTLIPIKSNAARKRLTEPTLPNSTYITPHIQDSEGIQNKIRAHKISPSTKWLKFIPTKSYAATKQSIKPTLINSTYTTPHIQNSEGTLTRRTTSKIPYSSSQLSELVTKPLRYHLSTKSPTKSSRRGRSKPKAKCKKSRRKSNPIPV
ncbi:hypothetical protein CDAR_4981 [Caerostris darwini]|uniref:Uncharacterized protein n=1 Tax=Caerostris darwini TaxID=1538125 RepID=A0AAV4P3Z4_9ARAC|nr:hypothetical protein CDAR_4981 [Caerostris darwini]